MTRLVAAAIAFALSVGTAVTADATGSLVDIGGRKVYVECAGSGSPTVVLISGYRNDGEVWTTDPGNGAAVFRAVSGFTRTCTYDRPGTILDENHASRSDPVPQPRTADAIVDELHATLAKADIKPPYVFVAHSLGGLFARLYASTYSGEVVGMVLVDAWQEDLPAILGPKQWQAYVTLAEPPPPGLESFPSLEQVDFGAASARLSAAAQATPLPPIPLFVLSRGRTVVIPPNPPANFSLSDFEAAWKKGQEKLAALVPATRHQVAENSDHYIQLEQPDLVVDAVRAVVDAVHDPASWSRPK